MMSIYKYYWTVINSKIFVTCSQNCLMKAVLIIQNGKGIIKEVHVVQPQ